MALSLHAQPVAAGAVGRHRPSPLCRACRTGLGGTSVSAAHSPPTGPLSSASPRHLCPRRRRAGQSTVRSPFSHTSVPRRARPGQLAPAYHGAQAQPWPALTKGGRSHHAPRSAQGARRRLGSGLVRGHHARLKRGTVCLRPIRRFPSKRERHTLVCRQRDGFWNTNALRALELRGSTEGVCPAPLSPWGTSGGWPWGSSLQPPARG